MNAPTPPRWLERVLEWAVPPGLSGQGTLGDLAEEFASRSRRSPVRAAAWYAGQVLSVLAYGFVAADAGRGGPEGRAGGRDAGGELGGDRGPGSPGRAGPSRAANVLDGVLTDLRGAARSLLRSPGSTLGVVVVLGLGLGANAAVFSVVDGTLENTSWWQAPDAAVAIWPDRQFALGHLELYGDEQSVYRALGAWSELAFAVRTADGDSVSVNGVRITPSLFRELATQPVLGRGLAEGDAVPGGEPVVVIGADLWRRSFGADPAIVGERIEIGGTPATVVGVQDAAGGAPGGRAEIWLPLVMDPREEDYWLDQSHRLVGVLRDGATLDDAFRDLMAFTDTLSRTYPMFYAPGFAEGLASVARADAVQRRLVSTPLRLLFAGTALLLLVTALNVGNLLLGRAIDRRRELAIRIALGASPARVVRQLLIDGLILTMPALGLALWTAALGGGWIARLFVDQPLVGSSSVLAPPVLAFSLAIAFVAWLVVSGVPVAHFLHSLGSGRRGSTARPGAGTRVQRGLVVAQAGLAMLLLVFATLLVATVDNLRDVPLGFDPAGLLTVELSPPEARVASVPVARELYDRLVASVASVPGVESVGLTGWLPLRARAPAMPINPREAPVDPREAVQAPLHRVDPGFFEALGVVPLEGRLLDKRDRGPAPSAIVVNRTLAETLWPDAGAVGQRIAIDPHAWTEWIPVVGVVPDVRSSSIAEPVAPAMYVALAESPSRDVTLVVRTAGDPGDWIAPLRGAVTEADPVVPIRAISPMQEVVRAAYATSWVMMGLLIVLAVLATGLGAIGIYAVLAHHVAAHRREIGVRMALGARPGRVVGSVVRSGVLLAAVGIGIGSAVAAVSTRALESLLFGVSNLAPWAFAAPAVALAVAAAAAAWVPATRAGRLPPAEVLRGD